jgi:hypothetical protein
MGHPLYSHLDLGFVNNMNLPHTVSCRLVTAEFPNGIPVLCLQNDKAASLHPIKLHISDPEMRITQVMINGVMRLDEVGSDKEVPLTVNRAVPPDNMGQIYSTPSNVLSPLSNCFEWLDPFIPGATIVCSPDSSLDLITDSSGDDVPVSGGYPRIMGLAGLVPKDFVKDVHSRMNCVIRADEIEISMLILDHVTRMLKKKIVLRRWNTWLYDDGG